MFSAVSVCLCFLITSKRVNIGWWNLGVRCMCTKISAEFEFGGYSLLGCATPKRWRFAEPWCITQNVNKAMRSDDTFLQMHRAYRTCVRLRCWENQRRLSSLILWSTFVYISDSSSSTNVNDMLICHCSVQVAWYHCFTVTSAQHHITCRVYLRLQELRVRPPYRGSVRAASLAANRSTETSSGSNTAITGRLLWISLDYSALKD